MKRTIRHTLLRAALAAYMTAGSAVAAFSQAQEPAAEGTGGNRILEAVTQEAIATYEIPEDIMSNLSVNPGSLKRPGTTAKKRTDGAVQKLQGYRVQVFSDGRNPSTLQARAQARGNAIVAKFPKYRGQVYSFSSAPNWYTRIGNFKTMQEANQALAELKRAFPGFAAEMRVVKSQITIIK